MAVKCLPRDELSPNPQVAGAQGVDPYWRCSSFLVPVELRWGRQGCVRLSTSSEGRASAPLRSLRAPRRCRV